MVLRTVTDEAVLQGGKAREGESKGEMGSQRGVVGAERVGLVLTRKRGRKSGA
jgi:hypothetical protein